MKILKVGDVVDMNVAHYGYKGNDKPSDKSRIWAMIRTVDNDFFATGYIDNLFPEDYFGVDGAINREIKVPCIVTKVVIKEHSNGGRTNNKGYASLVEYLEDPIVLARVRHKMIGGMFDFSPGDPDRIDVEYEFKYVDVFDATFTITDSMWENIVPDEWTATILSSKIDDLEKADHFETFQEAISAQTAVDDLFGERYFPIIKTTLENREEIESIAGNFKNHSKTLVRGNNIYIGLRSKVDELYNIEDLYKNGGVILKNKEWDW